ncbi:MAG TPA: FAD-binding oxidoreductase [Thermomicrobiaceae bacterium]|nr:FAD-binding oxidoreductase [Thermomicrobiaceae bacterium]
MVTIGDRTTSSTFDEETIQALRASLRGELILPGEPAYDEARRVHNGMIDKHPALIARCADVADVIAAVNFAREHDVLLAVRGGGHNGPGLGTCDDGLVIDLARMNGIRVDPIARTVRVEGGCTLADVDHATHAFGLAVPLGIASTTGVAGLTLGGGMGHLTRKYGLTIDNLLEVDMVLADSRFVTANADAHADLFWAIRGGGGNFGVVTSFLFRLHPVSTVYAGPMFWHLDQAEDVLRWYGEFQTGSPEELNGSLMMISVPPGPPFPEALHNRTVCAIVWCYAGPLEQAEAVFAPIRAEFGPPALDWVGPMPFPALQSMFDAVFPRGIQMYWRADFVKDLPDAANALRAEYAARKPVGASLIGLHPIDGAASRIGSGATAWSYRDARWAEVFLGASLGPADNGRIVGWARESWGALHPFSAGGAYVNFMMEEGGDRVRAAYRGNYDRLAQIKATYDPANLFRVNQNIRPADPAS